MKGPSDSVTRRELVASGVKLAAGVALAPALTRFAGTTKGFPDEIAELERLVPDLMKQAGVPGASMAVIRDASVMWNRGFGVRDVATGAPVDDGTAFEAASVSKTVFAYAALQLCDRGTLSLDKPLTSY